MRRQAEPWKGALVGAVAGLVGGAAMNRFQRLWGKLTGDESDSEHAHPPRQYVSRRQLERRPHPREEEPATVKAAEAISQKVFDHELTRDERRAAGPAVHYAFSVTTGLAYGALAELAPASTRGFGLVFGAAVWAVADEAMVPLLGLSKPPAAYPPSKRLYSLAAHLVYGATTEAVRRRLRQG